MRGEDRLGPPSLHPSLTDACTHALTHSHTNAHAHALPSDLGGHVGALKVEAGLGEGGRGGGKDAGLVGTGELDDAKKRQGRRESVKTIFKHRRQRSIISCVYSGHKKRKIERGKGKRKAVFFFFFFGIQKWG